MQNYELDKRAETQPGLSRQTLERQTEKSEAQGILSPQRDPLAQVTCRVGDASCAGAHAATLHRGTASQPSRAVQSLLQLQRQYGNQYVQRVLAQARKGNGETEASPDVEQAIQRARGSGQTLDSSVRAQMELSFGADFRGVRVHADAQADELSRSLNARAFTTGQDIFFRQGAYSPGSSSGRELLAHELTHVVQQTSGGLQRKFTVGQPDDRYEQEADRMARAIMRQEQLPIEKDADEEVVQRQVEEDEEEKPVQAKVENFRVQRQVEEKEEEEEEPVQTKMGDFRVQRQVEEKEEEEEPIQAKPEDVLVQRQIEEEEKEEESIQAKAESTRAQPQREKLMKMKPISGTTGLVIQRRFVNQGRTATDRVHWAGGTGGRGGFVVGSIQRLVVPVFRGRNPGRPGNVARAWIRPRTGRIRVVRSYIGVRRGDQGGGPGNRWYLTERAARRVNRHERMHTRTSRDLYRRYLTPVLRLVKRYRGRRRALRYGSTQAEAIARLRTLVGWNPSITDFRDQDRAFNSPGGTVDAHDQASPTFWVNCGVGNVGGVHYNHRVHLPGEACPT